MHLTLRVVRKVEMNVDSDYGSFHTTNCQESDEYTVCDERKDLSGKICSQSCVRKKREKNILQWNYEKFKGRRD